MAGGTLLDVEHHTTHQMRLQPCLFLECKNCLTSAKHDLEALREPCPGQLVPPPF